MKYIVEFGTTSKINRVIGEADTVKECHQIIMKFLDDHNYKSHYQRMWVEDGKVTVDVGSWSEFFWISRWDGSSMAFEEINCLRWFYDSDDSGVHICSNYVDNNKH